MNTIEKIQTRVGVKVDGKWGPKTRAAVAAELGCKDDLKTIQSFVGAKADGVIGPKTLAAIADKLDIYNPESPFLRQSVIRTNKSAYGKAGDESNMVYVKPPYPIYYEGKVYPHGVRVHKLVADSLKNVFDELLATYGASAIHGLHMDVYGGGYVNKITTGGSLPSMHAYGLAIDWWPERNSYKTKSPQAGFSRPEYNAWWDIWEKHGWISLGRERNYDWMHIQAAKL